MLKSILTGSATVLAFPFLPFPASLGLGSALGFAGSLGFALGLLTILS